MAKSVELLWKAVFALEKNTVYVRDSDNVEHKLRVTKKVNIH